METEFLAPLIYYLIISDNLKEAIRDNKKAKNSVPNGIILSNWENTKPTIIIRRFSV